jgi:hypothetical protein
MAFSRTKACIAIRTAGVIACLAFAGWSADAMLRPMLSSLISDGWSLPAAFDAGLMLFSLMIPASSVWLAWRLWRRWNTATVRWLIGICLALLLLWLDMLPAEWTHGAHSPVGIMISSLLAIPLLIFGAIAYRYLVHRLIRFAELQDALNIYGQPVGHQDRIRSFAGLLGLAIFLAGGDVDSVFAFGKNRAPQWTGAIGLGSIVLGYLTYKIIVWYSKPRTRPAVLAGGFEVITNAPPTATRTELI